MKNVIPSATLILLFAAASFAQGTCTRHFEAAGKFSFCPPVGWTAGDSQSGPYKTFFTPATSTVKANFNVREEQTTISHEAYMMAALQILLAGNDARGAEARKVIGWTKFRTDSNLTGSRMVYETSYQGILLRSVQIILDLPGRKVLITGTALVADKATTDKIFDDVARSFAMTTR